MLNKIPDTIGCFASVNGKVFRMLASGNIKEVKPYYRKDGYGTVVLKTRTSRKPFYIHRCICSAFKTNTIEKTDVNHIDGNKKNNRIQNLEWCTKEENERHAVENKLKASGLRNSKSKLSVSDVIEIRKSDTPSRRLAKKYNVSKTTILNVKSGKARKYCGVL